MNLRTDQQNLPVRNNKGFCSEKIGKKMNGVSGTYGKTTKFPIIISSQSKKKNMKRRPKYYKKTMAENSSNLAKHTDLQILEVR